jgi:hypothetical protein
VLIKVGSPLFYSPLLDTGFVKGSILGVTVFGVYDYLILRHIRQESVNTPDESFSITGRIKKDSMVYIQRGEEVVRAQVSIRTTPETGVTLSVHVAAGALAGGAQSVVLDGWEIGSYWWHRQRYKGLHGGHAPDVTSLVNTPLVLRRLYHHSLGYLTLFGTYEFIRRQGQEHVRELLQSREPWVAERLEDLLERGIIHRKPATFKDDRDTYDLTILPLLVSFGAGGFAGQAHFVVSHYLRQFRKSSEFAHHQIRHPRAAVICMAFVPTAFSFVAFQYGGELTERLLEEDTSL